jgi:hypothetical protein
MIERKFKTPYFKGKKQTLAYTTHSLFHKSKHPFTELRKNNLKNPQDENDDK